MVVVRVVVTAWPAAGHSVLACLLATLGLAGCCVNVFVVLVSHILVTAEVLY